MNNCPPQPSYYKIKNSHLQINSAPLGPEKFDQNFLGKHWGGGPPIALATGGGGGVTQSTILKKNGFRRFFITNKPMWHLRFST